jgi:hypothetical protein
MVGMSTGRTDAPLSRLSLNTATTKRWTLKEAVDGAARAGLPAVGLWRDRVAEAGLATAARIVRDAGLRVSSLCRGGFLTAPDPRGSRRAAATSSARASGSPSCSPSWRRTPPSAGSASYSNPYTRCTAPTAR